MLLPTQGRTCRETSEDYVPDRIVLFYSLEEILSCHVTVTKVYALGRQTRGLKSLHAKMLRSNPVVSLTSAFED